MHNQSEPLAAEQQFFSSLIGGDVGALDRILGDDFLLIDVMTGSEVKKPDLLAVLGSASWPVLWSSPPTIRISDSDPVDRR